MEVDSQITTVRSVPLNCTLSTVIQHRLRTELHNRITLVVYHPPTQNVAVSTQFASILRIITDVGIFTSILSTMMLYNNQN